MRTTTVDFAIPAQDGAQSALLDLSFGVQPEAECLEIVRLNKYLRPVPPQQPNGPRPRHVLPVLAVLALTFASPLRFPDPLQELRRSGSSVAWNTRRRRGQRISWEEASRRVAHVYQEAQERRARQREADARELAWYIMGEEL